MLKTGQTYTVAIEKPAAGGRMIARVDGQVVLVSGAIPGEHVVIRIDKTGRGVAFGETVQIETASEDRRAVDFDPACGACVYAHVQYPRQLQLKSQVIADAFERIGRAPLDALPVVHGSPEDGYRMRARLHVRSGRLGFFREGTHSVCDFRATRQLLPETGDALEALTASLRDRGLEADCEIEISENIDASQRVAHVEFEPTAAAHLPPDAMPGSFTGLAVTHHRTGGSRTEVIAGDPHVTDVLTVDGQQIALRRHVLAFFQGNRYLLSSLVSHVLSHVRDEMAVVDLYAGVGLFAVSAAMARRAQVSAVEGDRTSARDLAVNADGRLTAFHESVEQFLERSPSAPDLLIADPPRTGLSAEALKGVIQLGASTVAYVSCDVATLARDARALVASGYRLERVVGFDLFPNTPHVESVATFART